MSYLSKVDWSNAFSPMDILIVVLCAVAVACLVGALYLLRH